MKLKVIFIFLMLVKLVCLFRFNELEWSEFKIKYGKYYDNESTERKHYQNFLKNWVTIHNHNIKHYLGIVTYKLSLNKMADYNRAERLKYFYGFNMTMEIQSRNKNKAPTFMKPENVVIPKSVNWVEEGAVTAVKDQEYCGSCWAFASTGALEGQHYRLTKKLVSLSEQNLLDCSWNYGNNGCHGGLMAYSYEYVRDNKGIDTEAAYPYDGEDWWCRFKPKYVGATDKGYMEIPSGSEQKLMQAVATVGPISVAINADSSDFIFYKEGIFVGKPCDNYEYVNHAVLVVGYDTDNKTGQDYWLVKNSWGTDWGERGYIRMARNTKNVNCIAKLASYPLM